MTRASPVLHLFCGKVAAGKSTLARQLASASGALLLSEDDWLSRLYPDEIRSVAGYARCSGRLRSALGDHLQALLGAGHSVVLDFPANTVPVRRWMRGLFEGAGADHKLHLLDAPDALCKARLRERNRAGCHAFAPGEADYDRITRHFVPPTPDEGFKLLIHPVPSD